MKEGSGRSLALRVLIVEDQQRLAVTMMRSLVEAGCLVDVVNDGPTGGARALIGAYDVVILDMRLPGLDGLQVCRWVRAADIDVPILICSAHDDVEDCVAAFAAGAGDYLVKPFALEELTARVHALGRRAARPAETLAAEAPTQSANGLGGFVRHAWAASARRLRGHAAV